MGENEKLNHAVAPYNFVGLSERVIKRYDNIDELPKHDVLGTDKEGNKLLSGVIQYTVVAETPIIVASGKDLKRDEETIKQFFKNNNDKYTIPGSTMRGLVRNNATILSFSSTEGYIEDNLFLYRSFAINSNKLRKEYEHRICINNANINEKTPGKVKAGYIYFDKKSQQYVIAPAKTIKGAGNKTFYRVSEMSLRRMKLDKLDINFMYNEKINDFKWKDKKSMTNEEKIGQRNNWYKYLKDIKNKRFKPYCTEVNFKLSIRGNNVSVKEINAPKNDGGYKGYLLCSNYFEKKTTHYIINEVDTEAEIIKLSDKEIRAYKEDLVRNKKKGTYYKLPKKGEKAKPIFYAIYNGIHYFGFTPYLRIFYDNSILDGVPEAHKNKDVLDYAKAIFGFTAAEGKGSKKKLTYTGYKGRVSFGDLEILGNPIYAKEAIIVGAEPKATCFPNYLEQPFGNDKSKLISYNDEDFKIRGIKQYWLKNKVITLKSKVDVKIRPLDKGNRFTGEIYFNNLHEDELGLLLWSLKLEEGCYHNIGMGKPYGYGKIKIEDMKVKVDNLCKKYSVFSFDYRESVDENYYIDTYKKFVKERYRLDKEIEDFEIIKSFFAIKSLILPEDETRNMHLSGNGLKHNEFSERAALPRIIDYVNGTVKPNDNAEIDKNYVKIASYGDSSQYTFNAKKYAENYSNNSSMDSPQMQNRDYRNNSRFTNSKKGVNRNSGNGEKRDQTAFEIALSKAREKDKKK